MLKKCLILILEITSMVKTVSHPAQDYGKFDLTVTKFETCKGPKRKDCAIVNATIKSRTCIDYRITVRQTMVPTKGKFDLTVTKFETCKGPKRKDCAIVNATIKSRTCIDYRITVRQTMVPTKGKVVAKSNGIQLFRLQLDNPCNHLFMRPLFHSLLNTTEDCRVMKGNYALIIDIDKIAQTYYGGEFLYGSLEFKSVFFSKDCNLSCSVITVSMSPKEQANNTEHK